MQDNRELHEQVEEIKKEYENKIVDLEFEYKNQFKKLEKENKRLNKIIDKFQVNVKKFIKWICHKFDMGAEDMPYLSLQITLLYFVLKFEIYI